MINDYLAESIRVKKEMSKDVKLLKTLERLGDSVVHCMRNNGKLLIAGNGGSAADSQHISAEFVSRFMFDRPGLPSIALTTDTSALTAIGNDYGFENLFSRQLEAIGNAGDIFIGISTSGNSPNIVKALKYCNSNGILAVGFTGANNGAMEQYCDITIKVPSHDTPHIQECHIVLGHLMCSLVEHNIYG
jgi:D-sedoheptulose 7-phosphate isomerase